MFPDQRNENVERFGRKEVAQRPNHGLGQVGQVVRDVGDQVGKNLVREKKVSKKGIFTIKLFT
jgi:hypothetical protein